MKYSANIYQEMREFVLSMLTTSAQLVFSVNSTYK